MLRRLRSGLAVRTAVCAAALLSLAGSAGLHPEPIGAPTHGAGPAATATAGHGGLRGAPHICQACTLYFACSLAPVGPAVPAMQPARAATLPSWAPFSGRTERCQHEGRAPPLAS